MKTSCRFLLPGALLCASAAMAQVAPTSVFQLDGETAQNANYPQCTYVVKGSNPATTTTAPCDYWNLLNGTGTVGQFTGGAGDHWNVRSFAAAGQGGLAYTQGSKDTDNPAGGWHYSSNPTPDKDTIENAYVAAYTGGTQKDLVLVFGAERNSVNGDANIGIWFFQQDVHPDPNSNTFIGNHVNNDVFLVSSFTGGGVTPTISIYIWDNHCSGADQAYVSNNPPASPNLVCAGNNIRYVTSQAALCSVLNADGTVSNVSSAAACAVTNEAPITVPWPSAVKSSNNGALPAQTFFTGGIDLTYYFKNILHVQNLPCFSSFLMDTRTSQSISSTLKDFLGGGFPLCDASIAKACQCDTILNNGIPLSGTSSSYEYQVSGTVTNTGFGDLSSVTVTDKTLTFNCGAIAAGASKLWGVGAGANDCTPATTNPACVGTNVGNGNCFISTDKPASNVASVSFTTPSGTTITKQSGTPAGTPVTCPATVAVAPQCNPTPAITPTKCCTVGLTTDANQIKVLVSYSGSVTNGPSSSEALTSVNVAEDNNNDGTIDVASLALHKFASDGTDLGTCTAPCTLLPGQKVTFSGSYIPSVFDPLSGGSLAGFKDKITVTAIRPDTGATLTSTLTSAECTICNGTACPIP